MSYRGYTFTKALCNVHHLRELTFVEEVLKQAWARKMKDLLLEMKAEVARAKAAGKQNVEVLERARLISRSDQILQEGYQANPPAPPPRSAHEASKVMPCSMPLLLSSMVNLYRSLGHLSSYLTFGSGQWQLDFQLIH